MNFHNKIATYFFNYKKIPLKMSVTMIILAGRPRLKSFAKVNNNYFVNRSKEWYNLMGEK
jgi:hypothetical protein